MGRRTSSKPGLSRRAEPVRRGAPSSPPPGPRASSAGGRLPSRAAAAKRIARLSDEIRRHDYLYYVLDRPEVSDEKYDRLYAELRRLEGAFPDLAGSDSPTRRVAGQPLPSFPAVRHLAPLLSLDSVTDPQEVWRFDRRAREALAVERIGYVAEPKLDGLANASINRETEALRTAFRLAVPDVIVRVPKFSKRLPEKNVRRGFFEQADVDALLPHLPPMLQDLVRLAFGCGWRRGEPFGLPPATSNTRMVRASVEFEALR